jgi:Domain of unknown function (DUF4332)
VRHGLELFPTLSDSDRLALGRIGVSTTDQLLDALGRHAWQGDEHEFAGIEIERLDSALVQADLVRIKGVGPAWAELLDRAGVRSAQDLARCQPAALIAGFDTSTRRPTLGELEEIIDEAAELRPRLDRSPKESRTFRKLLADKARRETRAGIPIDRAMVGVVLVALAVAIAMLGGEHVWGALNPRQLTVDDFGRIERVFQRFVLLAIGVVTLLVGVAGLTAAVLWTRLSRLLTLTILPRFLVKDSHRRCYRAFSDAVDVRTSVRWIWAGLAVLVATVALMLWAVGRADTSEAALASMIWIVLAVAPVVTAIVLAPHFIRMRVVRDSASHGWESIWRVSQWQFLYIFVGLAFLLAVVRLGFPAALAAHRSITASWLEPKFRRDLDTALRDFEQAVMAEALDSTGAASAIATLREGVLERAGRVTANVRDASIVQGQSWTLFDAIIPVVVIWCAWAAVFGCLLPVTMQRPRRTLFYLALLVSAGLLEYLVGAGLQSWLGRGAGPAVGLIVVAFVVLATEFGVDWVEELDATT